MTGVGFHHPPCRGNLSCLGSCSVCSRLAGGLSSRWVSCLLLPSHCRSPGIIDGHHHIQLFSHGFPRLNLVIRLRAWLGSAFIHSAVFPTPRTLKSLRGTWWLTLWVSQTHCYYMTELELEWSLSPFGTVVSEASTRNLLDVQIPQSSSSESVTRGGVQRFFPRP